MCFENEYEHSIFFKNIEFTENPSAVCYDKPTSKKFLLHITVMYKSLKYARKQVYICNYLNMYVLFQEMGVL